jgi:hypothetical protein
MSDLFKHTNISKYDKSDPRYVRVSESGVAKSYEKGEGKTIPYKNKSISALKLLYARLMQILFEKGENPESVDLSHLKAGEREFYLLNSALLGHLRKLSVKDKATDTAFINSLSKTWNNLILSVNRRRSQKNPHEYLDLLNEVIDSIESYGSNDGESFGYYLSHHQGKDADWFPIPYLQMLTALYEDHIVEKEDSYLSAWSHDLTLLLIEIKDGK